MKIVELSDSHNEIYDLNYELDSDRFTIRWRWPKNIDIVYILKISSLDDFSLDNINENSVKLYTREEYKEFNGYCEAIKEVNQYRYYIFSAVEDKGNILLLKQNNGKNQLTINTGKPEIFYEIKEMRSFKSFFSKEKTIQIIINSETALNKDVLCYVKKHGSYPVNKDDGICFDFISNIQAGRSVMPEITVDKNEYIKIFIKDVNKYGNVYDLKQE
ncbi:hypothetical protein [Clostridium sp. DJ247]|uniref:hypothetical protein n=1 Tax=Clostridium sp. DJ247 TaxID=2726188 RepID=UPI00162855FF|nr:hypothetical protein [Clostridium sp. DJ247]MBC2580428.1 hypothetical protein [Clostridium sp. DJ247]